MRVGQRARRRVLAALSVAAAALSPATPADAAARLAQTPPEPEAPAEGAITHGKPGKPENHVREALKHARSAAGGAKQGNASTIAEQARLAQTHVAAALREEPHDPHLKAASQSLSEAIAKAHDRPGEAREAAWEAADHLKAASQGQ
ncbi:small metal-binding protein SmbP [Candidatus Methylocalor cossyra]|uniref:Small metal-binding protein n=1 Tax=Candidatus Methylocalor cossyra TaxID=3108543 RepID=A0ABP1C676_9GAMM